MKTIQLENSFYFANDRILKRFSDLISFLKIHNIFYKKYIISGSIENIYKQLPIVNKNVIRENYNEYISSNNKEFAFEITSGTTGQPLKCLKTYEERTSSALHTWKCRKMIDKYVNIYNFTPLLGTTDSPYNMIDTGKENEKNILSYLSQKKPRWLSGSPTLLYRYALIYLKFKNKYDLSSIKFIEMQGENIEIERRNIIENAFQAKTIMHYGMRECWCIAYECKFGHMHVLDDTYIIESQQNELIITNLINRLMPIIRYKTGDEATVEYISKCDCGRNDVINLKLSNGRTAKSIYGYDGLIGNLIFHRVFTMVILKHGEKAINEYMIIQKSKHLFIFQIIKGVDYFDEIESELTQNTIEMLRADDIHIEFIYANQINLTDSGKHPLFVIDLK